jgi:hypothetical protein
MAIQLNGNGLSRESRAKRTMKGRETWWGEGGGENFKFSRAFRENRKKWGSQSSSGEKKG